MVEVSSILKAFSGFTRMIPNQNSSTTPQPEKAFKQEMRSYFHLFAYSHHLSPKLLIFVHGNAAKGKSERIAFIKQTKVN
jgi:hypothetical protein